MEGSKTQEVEGGVSCRTESRVPKEMSRCVQVTSRQIRGRRRADRADQVLRQTSQISYPGKYTPEEKMRIALEGFRREVTVNDLCRREGIKPHSYYSWTKDSSTGSGQESGKRGRRGLPVTASAMLPGRRSTRSSGRMVS